MLSRVIAKNVGDVFLRHSVLTYALLTLVRSLVIAKPDRATLFLRVLLDICRTDCSAKCRRSTHLLTSDVRAHDPTASGAALATRPRASPVPAVCSGIPLCARHSTGVSGWQPASDIRRCCSLSSALCRLSDVDQPVDQLSLIACFLWLQRGRGTVCHQRPGLPPRYWHFGGRPRFIFFVSHLADGNLALSLLIDS